MTTTCPIKQDERNTVVLKCF